MSLNKLLEEKERIQYVYDHPVTLLEKLKAMIKLRKINKDIRRQLQQMFKDV